MSLETAFLTSYALVLLRVVIAIVFFSSGKNHVQDPKGRGESIGLPPVLTAMLGSLEMLAAISLILGVFIQAGAALIILVMLGAIYKKTAVWKTGFYAEEGFGWHYDLLLLAGAFVIFSTGGGQFVLW